MTTDHNRSGHIPRSLSHVSYQRKIERDCASECLGIALERFQCGEDTLNRTINQFDILFDLPAEPQLNPGRYDPGEDVAQTASDQQEFCHKMAEKLNAVQQRMASVGRLVDKIDHNINLYRQAGNSLEQMHKTAPTPEIVIHEIEARPRIDPMCSSGTVLSTTAIYIWSDRTGQAHISVEQDYNNGARFDSRPIQINLDAHYPNNFYPKADNIEQLLQSDRAALLVSKLANSDLKIDWRDDVHTLGSWSMSGQNLEDTHPALAELVHMFDQLRSVDWQVARPASYFEQCDYNALGILPTTPDSEIDQLAHNECLEARRHLCVLDTAEVRNLFTNWRDELRKFTATQKRMRTAAKASI